MQRTTLTLALATLLPTLAAAQAPEGVRLTTTGPVLRHHLDVETGTLTDLPAASARVNEPCFDNTVDLNDIFADALLYPGEMELLDWGVKDCGGSTLVSRLVVGYSSLAVPTSGGGRGGDFTLRVYANGRGFGEPGTLVYEGRFTGVPSSGPGPTVEPRTLAIALGKDAFFLPDGPLAWSFENHDGLTAVLLVDVTIENGTQNYYDVYDGGPATPANYLTTTSLPAGPFSYDPLENSFHFQLFQDGTVADVTTIAGGNPVRLTAPLPAVVGHDWQGLFDLNGMSPATPTMLLLAWAAAPARTTRFGEVLIDLDTLLRPPSIVLGAAHVLSMPLDAGLLGLTFHAQGGILKLTGLELTNALEVRIGAQ